MKQILFFIIIFFSATSIYSQELTPAEWDKQAKTNIRLLPRYGNIPKTAEQKELDEKFIKETLQQEQFKGDSHAASDYMILLGFSYLNRKDIKTAMYRFNQAYLLDSLNSDIYWGYGAVYMALGNYERAKEQYEEGLTQNPDNTHLLTDLATFYMTRYYNFESIDKKSATENLDSAITYLLKSYQLNKTDPNTIFKLSVCYWNKTDCDNAWKYYNECKALGGQPITAAYTADLTKRCRRKE